MNKPEVSIITPLYNAEAFLHETIKSVLGQSFKNWELLLINDASPDSSGEIADDYAVKYSNISVIHFSENKGAAAARNAGIKVARGRFIAFLDSDDLWVVDKLKKQVELMKSDDVHLSYSYYEAVYENGEKTKLVFKAPKNLTYNTLLRTNYIGCSTAVYDTKFCGKVYMPDIKRRQDYGLWLTIVKLPGIRVRGIQESLTQYRLRKSSVSSNKIKAARYNWILYRKIEKLGFIKSVYYLLNYVFIGLLRRVGITRRK